MLLQSATTSPTTPMAATIVPSNPLTNAAMTIPTRMTTTAAVMLMSLAFLARTHLVLEARRGLGHEL